MSRCCPASPRSGSGHGGQRWWLTATAYVLGAALGGIAAGLTLGGVGAVWLAGTSTAARLAALAVVAATGLALDVTGRLPTRHRQVDERWLDRYRGWVYGGGFGIQLGVGVATIVPASITYVVFAAEVLVADMAIGALVGATFGVTRALPVLVAGRWRDPQRLRRAFRRIAALATPVDRLTRAAQGAAALAATGLAVAG